MNRLRKLRASEAVRNRNAQVALEADNFIYPYFIVEGANEKQEIASLKGVFRYSIDMLLIDIEETIATGINKILLFGVIDAPLKDALASHAYADNNLVVRAIREIKMKYPQLLVFTDVCLCGYTNHGHCGVLIGHEIENDATLPLLAEMALSHARAGADYVAPSAMMDGQVEVIKETLQKNNSKTGILSYSAKYASGFYGPFRDAANSSPSFGDRKTYQMDYRTIDQAIQEVAADIEEGANWVMVKPAHTYLDVIHRIKIRYPKIPLAAYQVSGEYMMIKAASDAGFMVEEAAMTEALTAIKRAGADFIISYYAKEFIRNSLQRS